ncbi:MAG: response regulator, partial [Anaeromyxobacteraceae bacterium]
GTLTIEARNEAMGPEAPVLPDRAATSLGVRLVVRDTGMGMTPDVQARVFEPFFTTKALGKGTGLGLATVFGIVEQSGGTISVESEQGRGTAFTIVLPRTADAVESTVPGTVTTSTSGTETVLVVDDEPLVREVTVRALRSGGYQVLTAAGGDDALALAGRADTHLDLVITDVVMPGMDGSAVAEELRRRDPRLPVLFVSGHAHDCVLHHGVSEGSVEFLSKPFTASSLRARVRQMLDAASRASRPASAGRGALARSAR